MLDDDISLGEWFDTAPTRVKKISPSKRLINNTLIGVEIEIENSLVLNDLLHEDGKAMTQWSVHEDHSLRNRGLEFVFRGPQGGLAAEEAITNFCNIAQACMKEDTGRRPIFSDRTSMHVHIDVNSLTRKEIIDLILLYSCFEKPLFKAFSPNREKNIFCLPYNSCLDYSPSVKYLHKGWDNFSDRILDVGIGRYCAFNLQSIRKYGTIEFRHCQASFDQEFIFDWINTLLSLVSAVKSDRIDFKEMFYNKSYVGYEYQLRRFFPQKTVDRIFNYYQSKPNLMESFNKDVAHGVRAAQCYTNLSPIQ